MVSSPMYDRLMEFANSAPDNEKLYGWDDEHSAIVKAIREARDKVNHFKEYQGFTGQAGQAMSDEATRAIKRFDKQANFYMTGMSYYVEARRAIMLAAEDARQLSPTLLDPMTESLRHAGEVTIPIASKFGLPGKFVNSLVADGLAYVEGVEAQANAQREAKATEIIERFESTMNDLNARLSEHSNTPPADVDFNGWTPIPELPADAADALRKGHIVISPHEGGAYGRSRSDAFGNAGLRGADSGLYPGGYDEGGDIDQRVMHSPRVPNRYLPEGDLGSRTNPITDPQDLMDVDLLHTRVNGDRHANGVIGGHTPAPPFDRDHPLWGLNTARAAEAQSAGRLGGAGLLGAGPWACAGRRAWVDLHWGPSGARVSSDPASPVGWERPPAPPHCAPDRSAALAWAPTRLLAAPPEWVRRGAAREDLQDSRAASWAVPAQELAAGRRTRRNVVAAGTRHSTSRTRKTRACRAAT
ncbi:hypothetical protein HMPREF1137_0332 [Actinomyces sp. ICM39]|uniref:hypothetical protein n=1 Tax=Actinomyces sp. ICM39 TaxID=1105029 RepID=UPI0002770C76|nr:hypothetical protein HMPREF1137_0332 [Actinomyces sp. ICM39]